MNQQAASYLMYRDGHLGDHRTTEPIFNARFGWAVKRGNAAKYTLVADGFAAIDSAQLESLGTKWRVTSPTAQYFARYSLWITCGLGVLVALLLLALTWSAMLRRGVTRQASILRSALADLRTVNLQAQEVRERLQLVVSAIPDLLFELDAQGRYLRVHTLVESLLAAPVAQLLGRSVRDVMPPKCSRHRTGGAVRGQRDWLRLRSHLPAPGAGWHALVRTVCGPQQDSLAGYGGGVHRAFA
jgi:PAS domain-containing protein